LFAGKKNPTGGVGLRLDWEVLLVTMRITIYRENNGDIIHRKKRNKFAK